MNKILAFFIFILFSVSLALGQESGNRNYGQPAHKPLERTGVLTGAINPGTPNSREVYFIEANVLLNQKPDSFVLIFGVDQEGATAAESNSKTDAQISGFLGDLEKLGVKRADTFVDFIAQNKIYDYTTTGNIVTEKFTGFETKKNINVRYKDRDMLNKIVDAAAKESIFDLIEVKYVVSDMSEIRTKLFAEAVKVIKQKEADYTNAFGIKLSPTNVATDKFDTFYPSDLYNDYQAFESGTTTGDYNRTVLRQRKTKTFYYQPLDVSKFDTVINQMGIEPEVQFTLYLRMQYDLKK